jgi:hypothetical protein
MSWEPISPPPLRRLRPEYLPAYLSSGLIGLRAGPIPLLDGLATVSALRGMHPVDRVESFARGPYPAAGDIEVDGHLLSRLPTQARFAEQRYDFSCGELSSRFRFSPGDGEPTADVEVLTFLCRSLPTLVAQEIRVTVDGPCSLSVRASVDQKGIDGRLLERETKVPGADESMVDGSMLWETHGALSRCGAAYVTTFDGGERVQRQLEDKNSLAPLSTTYSVQARPGRAYVLHQISALLPTAFHDEPDREASRLASIGGIRGFDQLREENRTAWRDLWRGRIRLLGADSRWQGYVDAAQYYLHASAHPSGLFSTAMFGLAYWPNYHYYRGHVMWDIECFTLPVLLLTDPSSARSMLEYRFRNLEAAKRNAALNGYAGVQFPWASSSEHGQEMIRTDAPVVAFEQHVNFSVALAFARFSHATGDSEFARERAWPVLRGVADWTISRAIRTSRGFEIRFALGPAERRRAPVDNDAYVNIGAIAALQEATALAERCGFPAPSSWAEVAEGMFLPRDGATGAILNHDRFDPDEEDAVVAGTPEAAAGLFPLGYRVEPEVEAATLRGALSRIDPYLGLPMLSAPAAVYAAWLGDRRRAAELFEAGYAEFVNEPYGEVNEFSNVRFPDKPRAAPLFANLGGLLTSLLYGLPRLRLGPGPPDSWCQGPVVMPEGWEGLEVERLWVRGRPASFAARHGAARPRLEVL